MTDDHRAAPRHSWRTRRGERDRGARRAEGLPGARFGLRYPLAHLRPFTDGRQPADIALTLLPDGPDSPVRLEPGVASGASTVGGVRTEILREQYEVGEDTRDIAERFGLDVHDVLAALRHEDKLRPLKIA